jgi:hypothetical protein
MGRKNLRGQKKIWLTFFHLHTYTYNPLITLPISRQGFSVTGYIRAETGMKQTKVDCELTNGALSSRD